MAFPSLVDSDDRSGWKQSSKVRKWCGWFGHLASDLDVFGGMEISAENIKFYSLKCFVSSVKSAQGKAPGMFMDGSGMFQG